MSAQHTPGPWKLDGNQYGGEIMGTQDGQDYHIATVYSHGRALKNAHIVEAASDMLKALQDIVAWHDETAPASRKMEAARAALAKARGEK